jgi:Protein of unknown function (DUF2971)
LTTLKKYLRRYTDIPSLVYLLSERQITLLDPETWDDKNDSHFLRLYREKTGLQSVLALCFTRASETYHHWRVFANGSSGVCIGFKREELLTVVKKQSGVRTGPVKYLKMREMERMNLTTRELPFLKRYPFEHENEFRIIYESNRKRPSFDIPIPLSCIDRITLSPWLNQALSKHVKKVLWSIEGCRDLEIVRSTLISNEDWKSFGDSAE